MVKRLEWMSESGQGKTIVEIALTFPISRPSLEITIKFSYGPFSLVVFISREIWVLFGKKKNICLTSFFKCYLMLLSGLVGSIKKKVVGTTLSSPIEEFWLRQNRTKGVFGSELGMKINILFLFIFFNG